MLSDVGVSEPDQGLSHRKGLWTRSFRLYFGARAVSLLGDTMLPVALTAGVLRAGYGASGVGYALSAWMIPVVLLTLFGGVLADRFTPRRMMVGADLVRLAVQGTFAVAFTLGAPALWQIISLQAASGVAAALFQPGVASLVPQVADDVQQANATLRIAEAIVSLLGPAFAGVLVAFAGVGVVFAVDAATFGVSALCILMLRLAPVMGTTAETRMWRNLVEGWREFTSRPWLWSVIAIWAVCGLVVFGPIEPLGASVITFAHGSAAFGIVMSAFGAGAILGGFLGLRLRPERPMTAGAIAMFAFAPCPLVVALVLPVHLIAIGYFFAGAGYAFWGVMWSTTVQTHIPAPILNRVYAYDVTGSLMILPVGRAVAGPVTDAVGTQPILLASAGVTVVCCAGMLAIPAVRNLRRVST